MEVTDALGRRAKNGAVERLNPFKVRTILRVTVGD
jgi:hypothetical protein